MFNYYRKGLGNTSFVEVGKEDNGFSWLRWLFYAALFGVGLWIGHTRGYAAGYGAGARREFLRTVGVY